MWQVLAIYVGASWVVFQIVQTVTEGLGLPQWFPPFAALLLLIGLPIVLATAFVQDAIAPTSRQDPTLLPGNARSAAPSESFGSGREGGRVRRVFTWRNAIVSGVLAFALWGVVAAGWLFLQESHAPAGERAIRSVAVLPFADLSAEADQQYFADGVAEEILDALAGLPGLKVTSRTSSFRFRESALDARVIGDSLGVDALLEGSVRKGADRVRITAQLIDAGTGNHLWSETYERRLADIFAVQEEIARAIVDAINLELGAEHRGRRIVREATTDPEAYELYLRGRYLWRGRTTKGLLRAISLFQEALELSPDFAAAYTGMAQAYVAVAHQRGSGLSLEEADRRAAAAARRALELDPTMAGPHAVLGTVAGRSRSWSEAEEHFQHAIALNPGDATAHHWYAILLGGLGRTEEALAEIRRAHELDPLSLQIQRRLGYTLYLARDYDAAIDALGTAIELVPERPEAYWRALIAEIHAVAGRAEQARLAADEALRLVASDTPAEDAKLEAAVTLALVGEEREARRLLNDVKSQIVERELLLTDRYLGQLVAAAHAALSEPDSVFRWLQEVQWDELSLNRIRWPTFDPIRADPRYGQLLDRYGVPR